MTQLTRVFSLSESGHAAQIQHARGRAAAELENTEVVSTSPRLECPEGWVANGTFPEGAGGTAGLAPKYWCNSTALCGGSGTN
jgi:hypothetical protein